MQEQWIPTDPTTVAWKHGIDKNVST